MNALANHENDGQKDEAGPNQVISIQDTSFNPDVDTSQLQSNQITQIPKWLWIIATIDMVSVLVEPKLGCTDVVFIPVRIQAGKLVVAHYTMKFATAVGDMTQLMQFIMGLILVFAQLSRENTSLTYLLRAYLFGSYILLAKIIAVILSLIMIPTTSEVLGYEEWCPVVGSLLSVIFRFIATVLIQKFLNKQTL